MAIFSKEQSEAIDMFSQGLGIALQDRFHKTQFEAFQKGELADFQRTSQEALMAVQENKDDPDAAAQAFLAYKSALGDLMTSSTTNYAGNPYVTQAAQQLFEFNKNAIGEFMQVEGQIEERAGREEAQELETRETEAGIGLKKGQTAEAYASAELKRAQAAKARTTAAGKADKILFTQEAMAADDPRMALALLV